jgi:hypothetical protein
MVHNMEVRSQRGNPAMVDECAVVGIADFITGI